MFPAPPVVAPGKWEWKSLALAAHAIFANMKMTLRLGFWRIAVAILQVILHFRG